LAVDFMQTAASRAKNLFVALQIIQMKRYHLPARARIAYRTREMFAGFQRYAARSS